MLRESAVKFRRLNVLSVFINSAFTLNLLFLYSKIRFFKSNSLKKDDLNEVFSSGRFIFLWHKLRNN